MRRSFLVFSLATVLVGCMANEKTNQNEQSHQSNRSDKTQTGKQDEKQPSNGQISKNLLPAYFPPDGTTAYFQGDGNEFASFTIQTKYITETAIAQIENNGGVILLKVYRITNTAVELVLLKAVEDSLALPTAKDITTLPIIETILQQPLEVGSRFNGWLIQSRTATVTTNRTTFHDVLKLVKTKDNITTYKYFAKDVGLIHTQDEMFTTTGETFVITSTLQKIE